MTPEERIERIENGWLELQQGHREIQQNQKDLNQSIQMLTEAVTKYVEASNERMTRMEANLDLLIRAITAEHSNGKGKPGGN